MQSESFLTTVGDVRSYRPRVVRSNRVELWGCDGGGGGLGDARGQLEDSLAGLLKRVAHFTLSLLLFFSQFSLKG